jgi:hypothetical protein
MKDRQLMRHMLFLREQLHKAHNTNQNLSTRYGKFHQTTSEALKAPGIFSIFGRTRYQARSDIAFEKAIAIVDKANPVITVGMKKK